MYSLTDDCSNTKAEIAKRVSLFPKLNITEIDRRKQIDINLASSSVKETILNKLIEAIHLAAENPPFLTVDVRYYKSASLANVIYSNIPDMELPAFLKTSKFNQGLFVLVNVNKDGVDIIPGDQVTDVTKTYIPRKDLTDSEFVINLSYIMADSHDQKVVSGNWKFTQGVYVSLIAEEISGIGLDLRAASTWQELIKEHYTMPVYDLKGSNLLGGKVTTGKFTYVGNEAISGQLDKFKDSEVICYQDPNGQPLLMGEGGEVIADHA
jgi:hypothetical protein